MLFVLDVNCNVITVMKCNKDQLNDISHGKVVIILMELVEVNFYFYFLSWKLLHIYLSIFILINIFYLF